LNGKVPWNVDTDKPLKDWQNFQITEEQLAHHFNGAATGVGVRTDLLADFDLDSPVSQFLGDRILPPTARFGRGNKTTHVVFECDADFYRSQELPNGKVELRASSGHQTMFPPSVHPDGEVLEWKNEPKLTALSEDELHREFAVLCIASILCEFYREGDRDNLLTILSHVLDKHLNLDVANIQSICDAIMDFHGDESRERRHKAVQTVKGLKKGVKKPGLNELKKIIRTPWTSSPTPLRASWNPFRVTFSPAPTASLLHPSPTLSSVPTRFPSARS
jgi:hypothetical protein